MPVWLRYLIVTETITAELGPDAPVTVCGGRRLDLAWDLYAKIFPPNRVFVTPTRDDFEDVKAAAWAALGETCYRADTSDLPVVSGTSIRERIASGSSLDGLVPETCHELLRANGYLESLGRL